MQYSDVTSKNTRSLNVTDTVTAQIVNSPYTDINVSLRANRIYTNDYMYLMDFLFDNVYRKRMINALDGFHLTSLDSYIKMHADDVSLNLISTHNNIDFKFEGPNVAYFYPSGLRVNSSGIWLLYKQQPEHSEQLWKQPYKFKHQFLYQTHCDCSTQYNEQLLYGWIWCFGGDGS